MKLDGDPTKPFSIEEGTVRYGAFRGLFYVCLV